MVIAIIFIFAGFAFAQGIETGTMTDQDGNVYQTVKIGDQWWMAENLKVTHYRNGDPIPNVTGSSEWDDLTTGAFCAYDNEESNADIYGYLYNWYAVDDSRNIAPEGWHVPSDDEWKELEMTLGMSESDADLFDYRGTDEGSKLAGMYDLWKDGGLKNNYAFGETGFSALPAGVRYHSGYNFDRLSENAQFWTATEDNDPIVYARTRNIYYLYSGVYRGNRKKHEGKSIRLVKDAGGTADFGIDNSIDDHLGDKLQGEQNFFQSLFDNVINDWFVPGGEKNLICDATLTLEFTNLDDITEVAATVVSPNDPDFSYPVTFSKNNDGSWERRIKISNKQVTAGDFLDIVSLFVQVPGEIALPTQDTEILAPFLEIEQVEVTTSTSQTYLKQVDYIVPTWQRNLQSEIGLMPGGTATHKVRVASPVDLVVWLDSGQYVGVIEGERYNNSIENAIATGDGEPEGVFLFGENDFDITLQGTSSGSFTLTVERNDIGVEETVEETVFSNVPISSNSSQFFLSIREGDDNRTLYIDQDGNGQYESSLEPDNSNGMTDIDGNTYTTVTINGQEWTAENLKVTRYRNGDPIPQVTDAYQWVNLSTGARCAYNNSEANADTYGYLYNWYAVHDSRKIGPAGWRVPTNDEYQSLIDYLGGRDAAGGKMKSTGTQFWDAPNAGATNESGFSALPAGSRELYGEYNNLGHYANFWTSTSYYNADSAWFRVMSSEHARANQYCFSKFHGISVRLIRDPNEDETSVSEDFRRRPEGFILHQNYPNPFNPQTTIRYSLPYKDHIRISIYNSLGRQVAFLVDSVQEPGTHSIKWDASAFPAGIYVIRFAGSSFTQVTKCVLMK